jgi:hypothetical protein
LAIIRFVIREISLPKPSVGILNILA